MSAFSMIDSMKSNWRNWTAVYYLIKHILCFPVIRLQISNRLYGFVFQPLSIVLLTRVFLELFVIKIIWRCLYLLFPLCF